jgi:DNA-binding MurR/RpiR family transcriptional regulator
MSKENLTLSEIIKQHYPRLTETQMKIANYILENEDSTAFLTLNRLSAQIGVSPASFTRFAVDLGFSGYAELQNSLRESLQQRLHPTFRLKTGIGENENDIFQRSIQMDIQKIQDSMELNSYSMMESIVKQLLKARNIYIIGYRSSYSIVSYLNVNLEQILGNVTVINHIESMKPEYLLRMSDEDVLISISFPRYNQETMEFTEVAQNQGVKILAITDSVTSPLIQYADTYLLSKFEGVSFHNSYVSILSLINAIFASLVVSLKDQVQDRLNLIEQLSSDVVSKLYKKQ